MAQSDSPRFLKRTIDIVGSLAALLILVGPLIIITIMVRLKLGRPVIFRQLRPGKNGKTFLLNKFRTMRELRDERGRLLPDEYRLTGLGKTLRKWSLDELPELWNVITGDLSLVGPRPLLVEYLDRYTPEQALRHEVKPGITGWAQVNGRNASTWEEKFRYDIWYVKNWSLSLDTKILWMTIIKVLRSEGINQPGKATMDKFQGSGGKGGKQVC